MSFYTACKDCVFAKKENNVQTGCLFNRLDKFKEQNKAELLEDGSYLIHRFCNTCRSQDSVPGLSPEEAMPIVKKETYSRVGVIIDCTKNNNLDPTIKSILNQEIKPKFIYCLFNKNAEVISVFHKYNELFKINNIDFNIKKYLEDDSTNNMIKEIVHKNFKFANFFGYIEAGKTLEKDTFKNFDNLINEEMKVLHYISGNNIKIFSSFIVNFCEFENLDKTFETEDYNKFKWTI